MKRYYNVTGEDRKRMVSIIGEVIGEKPYYLRMPTCGYKIGAVTVTKDGTMIWDGRTSEETVVKIMEILAEAGFTAAENANVITEEVETPESDTSESTSDETDCDRADEIEDEQDEQDESETVQETDAGESESTDGDTSLTISFPADGFTEANLANLLKLIASKATLIQKSLHADRLEVMIDDSQISFPWWDHVQPIDGPEDCMPITIYTEFLSALVKMAREVRRVEGIERPTESEKYSMRIFLLRLGFVGAEGKRVRRELLKDLSGHSAFRNQVEAEKFYARQKEKKESRADAE